MSTEPNRIWTPDSPAGDEEWKDRVQAENRALDESLKAEQKTDAAPSSSADATATADEEKHDHDHDGPTAGRRAPQLPEADFVTLVTMFSTQAMVGLGVVPHPASGKPEPQLELAKHFIDLLGVLEAKTKGNLDAGERRLLDSTLHDLRMAWVRSR